MRSVRLPSDGHVVHTYTHELQVDALTFCYHRYYDSRSEVNDDSSIPIQDCTIPQVQGIVATAQAVIQLLTGGSSTCIYQKSRHFPARSNPYPVVGYSIACGELFWPHVRYQRQSHCDTHWRVWHCTLVLNIHCCWQAVQCDRHPSLVRCLSDSGSFGGRHGADHGCSDLHFRLYND